MIRYALFHKGNGKLRSLVWHSKKKALDYINGNPEMKYCEIKKVKITILENGDLMAKKKKMKVRIHKDNVVCKACKFNNNCRDLKYKRMHNCKKYNDYNKEVNHG